MTIAVNTRKHRFLTMAATLGVAVSMAAGAATPVNAQVATNAAHFAECASLILSDPEAHAANCLPGRNSRPTGPISGGGGGSYCTDKVKTYVILKKGYWVKGVWKKYTPVENWDCVDYRENPYVIKKVIQLKKKRRGYNNVQ